MGLLEKNIFVVLLVVITILCAELFTERHKRREVESELETTRSDLKKLCEKCIDENFSVHARITYQAYFGRPVDHTGDGFIDGEE